MRSVAIYTTLALATLAPIAIATTNPWLASRGPAYIIGGFAGITALSLLLIQPLLAANLLPMSPRKSRKSHRILGTALILLTALHIIGLYVTSPADTLDALLLRSPTPFSIYGVTALSGVIITAILVTQRKRFAPSQWRHLHTSLALVIVIATVIHALLIQGAMGAASKWIICILVIATTLAVLIRIRILIPLAKRR